MKKAFFISTGISLTLISTTVAQTPVTADSLQIELEQVTVAATRASQHTPVAYNNLKRNEITENNAAKNIPFILQNLPSVVAIAEDGVGVGNTTIRIRGVDATRINVTLNGMPLNNPESQEVYWVNLPDISNSLHDIQVQRGVGVSSNGMASIGGSISLNTLGGRNKAYGEVSAALGSYNTWLYSAAAGSGILKSGLSLDARFSQVKSDGYIRNGKVDHNNLYAALSYYRPSSLLRLSYMRGEQHTGITWEGISEDDLKRNPQYNPAGEYTDDNGNTCYYDNETDNYFSDIVQLSYSRFLNRRWTLNGNLNYNHGYGYYENYKTARKFGSYYGLSNQTVDGTEYSRSDAIHRKGLENDFYVANLSATYTNDSFSAVAGAMASFFDGSHFGNLIWAKYNENIPKNYRWYYNTGDKNDYNIFAKARYSVFKNFNIYADLQYRYLSYTMDGTDDDLAEIKDHQNYHFFNPKAGAVYMLQRWGEIYASAGVVNREPLRADIKESLKGNAEHKIKPERLYDYELGYRVSQNIWSAAVNLYYMDYKNQMVQTGKLSSNGYKLMENVAESYRAGVELNGKYSPFQFLELQINATFSRNKINSYTAYYAIYDADWNPLPQQYSEYYDQTDISFSPSIISASGITLKPLQNLSISLMNKYVGKQYYDNTSTESRRLPAYWVSYLNVSNRYQLKKVGELELQFLINNLFNRQYIANAWTDADKIEDNGQITEERYSGFFPQAPRNFMLKIGIKFQ